MDKSSSEENDGFISQRKKSYDNCGIILSSFSDEVDHFYKHNRKKKRILFIRGYSLYLYSHKKREKNVRIPLFYIN